MFEAAGLEKTGDEWYEFRLKEVYQIVIEEGADF